MSTSTPEAVRLDRWLDVACLFKTRNQAREACVKGRLSVNGQVAKPHRQLHVGDIIEIDCGDWIRRVEVKLLGEKSVSKALARTMYDDQSEARPRMDLIDRIMLTAPSMAREKGMGRPTKRERRQQERIRRDHE